MIRKDRKVTLVAPAILVFRSASVHYYQCHDSVTNTTQHLALVIFFKVDDDI